MSNIWFTSDTHYFHKNIAGPKVSTWKSGYRNFEDEKEMSRHIVKVFNQTVKEDDILYHCGDWSFGGTQNIWNFRKQLRCKNIHLIHGNHDTHIKKDIELPNCKRAELYSSIFIDGEPIGGDTCDYVLLSSLFVSTNDTLTVKHGNHTFFLSHYSHRVWEGSHKGIIHLYGHSHGSIPDYGKSMDCGIDVAKRLLGDYRPFSIEEIIQIMDRKEITFPDHHDSKTNIK